MICELLNRFLQPMTVYKTILIFLLTFAANIAFANQDSIQHKIDYYLSQAKFDSAKHLIKTSLEVVFEKDSRNSLNYQLVKVLFIQSEYDTALEHAFSSIDKINNQAESVNFNFMIGCIYSAISDYPKSVEYLNLVTNSSRDSSLTVQTHLLLSELHLELGDPSESLESLTKAYKITQQSNLDEKIKNHVAMQYSFQSEDYERCKKLNLKIITDNTSYLSSKTYAYSMIGDCLIKQDSFSAATKYYDEFLKLTFKTKDPEQIKIAAEKLIHVYEKLGLQEKANTYHKIYNEAESDTLSFSSEKYRNLYNVEKNRELAIAKETLMRNYILIASCFLIILSFVLYYYINSKNENNRPAFESAKTPAKKIVISETEILKLESAVKKLITDKTFLTSNITRKSFCKINDIKSERYLSHYINEKYNKSFSVFLNDLRIEFAYNRIQNDAVFRNYKIEEIAKSSGFGSKKSFERAFTTKYGLTPFKVISNITN